MRVAFCTTCKGRTEHLKQTLPRNLAGNPRALHVVLDYNSHDDLLAYLGSVHRGDLDAGRLVVYSYRDSPKFRMSHAKNMAHRCAMREGADVLVNVDADNFAGAGFANYVKRRFDWDDNIFLWAHMVKGRMVRGISGRMAVGRQAFLKSGGYDEAKFDAWGSDDKDFNLRLRALGYRDVDIDPLYLSGVPHNNKVRFRDYPHMESLADDCFTVDRSTITHGVINGGAIGCGVVYRNLDFSCSISINPVPTRVFGIGMHKTATTSLHSAFQIFGYDSWHWSSAHDAKTIWREINSVGRSPLLERYYALCDLPVPLLYQQLDRAYPGSKFVLTVRSECAWLEAVEHHFDPTYNKWRSGWNQDPFTNRVHQLLYGRQDFDAEVMLARYRRHNAEVLAYFKDRPRDLLVMDMDGGAGWPELCGFLGEPVPEVPYPRVNGTSKEAVAGQ